MSPEEWKAASERLLTARRIPINQGLSVIESDDEVNLRNPEEVLHRLVALWAVAGTASLRDRDDFREYIRGRKYEGWLSENGRGFLFGENRTERGYIQYSWRTESLYFLAWCAGLVRSIEIPEGQSDINEVIPLFPKEREEPSVLASAIQIRPKEEILHWSDLLYRLHWAVRETDINGEDLPWILNQSRGRARVAFGGELDDSI